MRARKKAIDVYAIKFEDSLPLQYYIDLITEKSGEPVYYDDDKNKLSIVKCRGTISTAVGNWIIYEFNTDKQIWFIDDTIFNRTYTKVDGVDNLYRKNIYEVDYVPFVDFSSASIVNVMEFLGLKRPCGVSEILTCDDLIQSVRNNGCIPIDTLEGTENLFPSDILIRGVAGEYYHVTRENFLRVYEIV